jgi:arylsulfatase A-like enzyme
MTARELYPGYVYTPNIDQLAAEGTSFRNAHVQIALCNPSRASVWSGQAPADTAIHTNPPTWFNFVDPGSTLHAQLKQAGYQTVGAGKIYHTPSTPVRATLFDQYTIASDTSGEDGPWTGPVEELGDWKNTTAIVDFINSYDPESGKPFFATLGLNRPHSPNIVPQAYFDLYPIEEVQLPAYIPDDLADVPSSIADNDTPYETKPVNEWKADIQAYLAANSFADAMLGRVLEALHSRGLAESTTIVVWSDNGIQSGQKDTFDKHVLWDASTRVPFLIVDPEVGGPGQVVDQPVEMLDLFPTVHELAGLPIPAHADGRSLVPLLADPNTPWDGAAFSSAFGSFSVRTADWRYTRYFDGQEELYDHRAGPNEDPHEWTNRANNPDFAEHKQQQAARLDAYLARHSILVAPPGAARLDGTPGNDTLINATGNTILAGGNGNDVYIMATGTKPPIVESSDPTLGGLDTLLVEGSYSLTQWVERMYVRDVRAPVDLYANGRDNLVFGTINFADSLRGTTGNDTIYSFGGNDLVVGGKGNDFLDAQTGNDILRGLDGRDTLIGGTGDDAFQYLARIDSPAGSERDFISGFDGVGAAGGDWIDLSAIDANLGVTGNQEFTFIGTAPFSGPGQIRTMNEGRDTVIQINCNADLAPEMEIQVNDGGATAAQWTAADFVL